MPKLTITAKGDANLNHIVERLFEVYDEPAQQFKAFDIIEGKKSLFGSGDAPVLKVVCAYNEDNDIRPEAVELLIKLAEEAGMDVTIEVDESG